MDIKRKNIPEGMRDMIGYENTPAEKLGERLCSMYEKRGYVKVTTPALEYYDVFNFASQIIPEENMYKLTDKSGRLVVMRPDNTTPLARIAATRLKNAPLPIKLYYNQNVFRVPHDYSGKRSEFTQTGIEIIGADSARADIEVLVTALRTLREISSFFGGDVKYKLEIGHVGFCKALLESMELEHDQFEKVLSYVGAKNSSALDIGLDPGPKVDAALEKIRALPRLYGTGEVLTTARQLCEGNSDAERVIDYLGKILDILEQNGLNENVCIDLAMVNDMDYYTGLVFKGYLEHTGEAVLGGGRYDSMLSNFDMNAPATGFGVNLSLIADKLTRAFGGDKEQKRITLVHYKEPSLLSRALNYMENCENTCVLSCFEKLSDALDYASSAGIYKVVEIDSTGIREVKEI